MARFRPQVSKGIEEENKSINQNMETINHDLDVETENSVIELQRQEPAHKSAEENNSTLASSPYGESDMELVNVAGFKVPYVVREHWKKECRKKRVKLSPILKEFLVNEFGLPPGISLKDL